MLAHLFCLSFSATFLTPTFLFPRLDFYSNTTKFQKKYFRNCTYEGARGQKPHKDKTQKLLGHLPSSKTEVSEESCLKKDGNSLIQSLLMENFL